MGMGSIPGQETKIPHATPHGQKIIKKGKFGQDMHTERTLCKDKGGEWGDAAEAKEHRSLAAKRRELREKPQCLRIPRSNQPYWNLDFVLSASKTETIHFYHLSHSVCDTFYQ